jgi:hypothetical protein
MEVSNLRRIASTMTIARRIARPRPARAGRPHFVGARGARARALGAAMLGAGAGLAAGAAVLVAAPGIGGLTQIDSTRAERPAARALESVAAVIAPARRVAGAAGQDRHEARP